MSDPGMETLFVRPAASADDDAIVAIYNHYVVQTTVSFEEEPVTADIIGQRRRGVADAGLPWLIAETGGRIVGYAYGARWHARAAYRHTAESTVYIHPDAVGKGVGSALYGALFPLLRECGIHAVIGGIALPNAASVALHEKFGMKKISHFAEVGYKFGRWIDVGHWQVRF